MSDYHFLRSFLVNPIQNLFISKVFLRMLYLKIPKQNKNEPTLEIGQLSKKY